MMLPMALAVIRRAEYNASEQADDRGAEGLSKCLLLGMAYAASIGGMATPVGTPPNLIFLRIYAISFPEAPPISFGQWVVFGLPFSAIMLLLTWLILTRVLYRNTLTHTVVDATAVREEYRLLGRMSREELLIMLVFSTTAFLWCFRNDLVLGAWTVPGWSRLLTTGNLIDDGTIAILMALLLFIIPTFRKQVPSATESEMPGAVSSPPATHARGTILDGEVFRQLPWAIVLLFGGGFALAEGFVQSGLADYLVGGFTDLGKLPVFVMVAIIALGMTFLTELTSNTASTQMVLPVLAAAAVSQEIHPLLLMLPATLAASMAFMMPVATPPNAIVFSSERLRILDMARTGFIMNLIGVVLVTFFVVQVARVVFQIEVSK
jgi:sodium-dependent dicarboxylate transporter 2/3/5